MSEKEILAALSADNVRAHVEHICNNIPSRLAGSDNQRRMAEYSAKTLREAGIAVTMHTLPGLVSYPEKAELKVLSPVELTIEANTLGHSTQTPPEGVTGLLLDVYTGAFEEFQGKDPKGAITLSELSYSPARHEKQRIAGLLGAAGCVMMNWGHDTNASVPWGSVKPVWGNPTPDNYGTEMPVLPCIGIARTEGLKLREMAKKGPVRLRFRTKVENGWRPIWITTGEIQPRSEDFVVLGGHQDSWFGPAATDNAAGNSCVMELARVFSLHRDRLREHMAAYVEIDQPACTGTTWWSTSSNAELRRFHQAIERRLMPGRTLKWKRAVKVGDASFFGLGAPTLGGHAAFTEEELKATALATLGWWHHTLECTIDKVDFNQMPTHLSVYASYLWELLTAPVLPYTYVPVAEQFIGRLTELAAPGKAIGLDGALVRAEQFRAAAARFDEAADRWRERYAKDGTKDDGAKLLTAKWGDLSKPTSPPP